MDENTPVSASEAAWRLETVLKAAEARTADTDWQVALELCNARKALDKEAFTAIVEPLGFSASRVSRYCLFAELIQSGSGLTI